MVNDLTTAGIVIWGLHRGTRELAAIGLPVFSLGALPTGPLGLNARGPDVRRSPTIGAHGGPVEE